MLVELERDNRAALRTLFDHYPYLHGSVAAVIEGGMGRVFTAAMARQLGFRSSGKYEAYRLKTPEERTLSK